MLVTESEQTQTSDKMGKTSGDYAKPIEDGVQPTQVNNFLVNLITMVMKTRHNRALLKINETVFASNLLVF